MEKIIKIILSLLLFGCLLDMPYGYFQFVRFFAMISFTYFAVLSNKKNRNNEVFLYIGMAILFQPFIKIDLGRIIWNIVDVIVGVCLIISLFNRKAKNKKSLSHLAE